MISLLKAILAPKKYFRKIPKDLVKYKNKIHVGILKIPQKVK